MKVKNDHHNEFSNLSIRKEEALKKSGVQRDSNPVSGFESGIGIQTQYRDSNPVSGFEPGIGIRTRYHRGHGFQSR